MRHTPCGCRSAYLAQVQPNHYLPIVPTNAASAAMLPWQAAASPITSEVDGNCVRPTNRRQSGSEDRSKSNRLDTKTAGTRFRRLRSSSSARLPMRGSRGTPLAFLWGFQRGYSLRKENTPFVPCSAVGAALPPRGAGNVLTNKQICPLEA